MTNVLQAESVKETALYRRLAELSDPITMNIFSNLETMCIEACDRIKEMPRYAPQYTLHDEVHFVRVTELMCVVAGDTLQKLNSLEIILLILSAYYHDQGMVPDKYEIEKIESLDKFMIFRDSWYLEHPNRNELQNKIKEPKLSDGERERLVSLVKELDGAMLTDYLRVTHGERGKEIIKNKFENDPRLEVAKVNISRILGNLCQSHTISVDEIIKSQELNVDEQIGTQKINLKYLAAILRLADIMDFDRDRTPEILFKSIHFTSQISIQEWEKHRGVQGWEISKNRIRFTLEFEHPVYEASARRFLDWIDRELSDCKNMCSLFPSEQAPYQLLLPHNVERDRIRAKGSSYIFHDLEFSLSRDEIVKLLMTDKLYGKPSLCIRELLQNSLDALRYRKALFKCQDAEWSAGEVRFEHYVDDNGYETLKCKDNGVGMDEGIITKFFCKAGRSYYRSPEFERKRIEFRSKGVDFDPCAKFGIGFMSCFMIGDRIIIQTRRDYGDGRGKPLIVEINGLGGMLVIKEGKANQEIGTTVTIQKRTKSRIFDSWDDQIKLTEVLQSYAMVTEFPIHAECKIEAIGEKISIPVVFEKPPTSFESYEIINQKVIECDFNAIDKQLNGVIRESFLTDEMGLPTVENREAKFIGTKVLSNSLEWRLEVNGKNEKFTLLRNHENVSVCLDGILVAGRKGRESFRKKYKWGLSWNNPPIHDRATVLLDVRGDVKPELTPARLPPDTSSFEILPGWLRLQDYLNIGSGKIWNQVIEMLAKEGRNEEIWKLSAIYSSRFPNCSADLLLKNLPIPIISNNVQSWKMLGALPELKFRTNSNSSQLLIDSTSEIEFDKKLYDWEAAGTQHQSLRWHLTNTVIYASELSVKDNNIMLSIRKTYNGSEMLSSDRYLSKGIHNDCKFIDFLNVDKNVIAVQTHLALANRNHPLSTIALKNRYSNNKDVLNEFATYFTIGMAQSLSNDKAKNFNLRQKTRWRKRIASLYFDVLWENYSEDLRAPYKIWTEKDGWTEITESTLKDWATGTNQDIEEIV